MPMLWIKARKMRANDAVHIYMLVSRHRDGTLIGSILRRFGVNVLHGSKAVVRACGGQ